MGSFIGRTTRGFVTRALSHFSASPSKCQATEDVGKAARSVILKDEIGDGYLYMGKGDKRTKRGKVGGGGMAWCSAPYEINEFYAWDYSLRDWRCRSSKVPLARWDARDFKSQLYVMPGLESSTSACLQNSALNQVI